MPREASRHDDEMLLDWIKLRAGGQKSVRIGETYGVSGQRVSTATVRVMQADMAESGEDVTGVYW